MMEPIHARIEAPDVPLAVSSDYQMPAVRANLPDQAGANEVKIIGGFIPDLEQPKPQATIETPAFSGYTRVVFVAPSWMILISVVAIAVAIGAVALYVRRK